MHPLWGTQYAARQIPLPTVVLHGLGLCANIVCRCLVLLSEMPLNLSRPLSRSGYSTSCIDARTNGLAGRRVPRPLPAPPARLRTVISPPAARCRSDSRRCENTLPAVPNPCLTAGSQAHRACIRALCAGGHNSLRCDACSSAAARLIANHLHGPTFRLLCSTERMLASSWRTRCRGAHTCRARPVRHLS